MSAPFVLSKEPAAWWPVVLRFPTDGGEVAEHRLELKFVRLGFADFNAEWGGALEEARAIVSGQPIPQRSTEEVAARNRRLFDRCVRSWRNIVDGEGSPLPFSEPHIGDLLDLPGFPEAFGDAYWNFWRAMPEIVQGNSVLSPDGGPATAPAAAAAATPATANRSQRRSGVGARPNRK